MVLDEQYNTQKQIVVWAEQAGVYDSLKINTGCDGSLDLGKERNLRKIYTWHKSWWVAVEYTHRQQKVVKRKMMEGSLGQSTLEPCSKSVQLFKTSNVELVKTVPI